ncbi:DUF5615 family PIN-like protein [Candidatus Woesearchaeota archaeon]|nr:DUF5615 family PIN-like protein [Candidatus Woesearchaeota archaeon]
MRFFLDANIPYSAVRIFQELGLETVHTRDVNLGSAEDAEIMNYAAKGSYIIVTKDLEFANTNIFPARLHHGVVILRFPSTFIASRFGNALKDFLTSVDISLLRKAVTIVKLGRYRIRRC